MRCDQIIGLSKAGKEYLSKHAVKDLILKIRNNVVIMSKETIACEETDEYAIEGYDTIYLLKYLLKDNTWVYEYSQEIIFSSGAMYFLALKNENGNVIKKTLWTDTELNKYDE